MFYIYVINKDIHWFQSSNTYAFKCKFSSANLREMRNIQDELSCGQQCDSTPRCTHFTLLDNVCRLHAGPIEESKALEDPKSSCGFASIKGNLLIIYLIILMTYLIRIYLNGCLR